MDVRVAKNLIDFLTGKDRIRLTGDEVPFFVEGVVALKRIAFPPEADPPASPPEEGGEKGSTTV